MGKIYFGEVSIWSIFDGFPYPFSSAWGPDTIEKMRGTSPEEVVPQAWKTAGSTERGFAHEITLRV